VEDACTYQHIRMTENDLLRVVHKIEFLPSDDAEVTHFIPVFRLFPFGAGVPKNS
jgi:hypothetical protein